MFFSSGSSNQPIWQPAFKQCKILFVTLVWLWAGDKISIVQSGWALNVLAISPSASRGMRFQRKMATSGTIERPPKVQPSSGNAQAIRWGLPAALTLVMSYPWIVLCFPCGIGFCTIAPLMYSLAGLVSASCKNSSRVIVFWGACTI